MGIRYLIQECSSAQEIIVIALGKVYLRLAITHADITVIAIVYKNIGDIASLLHHIGRAGKVIRPDMGQLRPCLMTVEPLPGHAQSQAGELVIQRLMGTLVYDDAVHPGGELQVCYRFQIPGPIRIAQSEHPHRCHGFRRHDRLTVNV